MPRTFTRFQYDESGLLVGSVSVTESEWSRDDVALLVMSGHLEREIGPHGIPMGEATDPKNQFGFEGHLFTDFAEKERLDTLERAKKDAPDASFNGAHVKVTRRGSQAPKWSAP